MSENYSKDSPKIRIFLEINKDDELKKQIEEIVRNLIQNCSKVLNKKELSLARFAEEDEKVSENCILITNEDEYIETNYKAVFLFIDDKLNQKMIQSIAKYEVWGIFAKKNFLIEYEEKGKFEAALKEAIRTLSMESVYDESVFYKNVDWKYKHENIEEDHFISLFLDPSMRNVASQIRYICHQIKEDYKHFGMKETFEKTKKILKDWHEKSKKGTRETPIFDFIKEKKIFEKTNIRGPIPSVLIEGETGTGKSLVAELIAKSVYENVSKTEIPFGEFFCRFSLVNMPSDLVNSELFGAAEGAYTDGKERLGKIATYSGGVIFLDEIGEIDPNMQARLLLYLDDWLIQPIGRDDFFHVPTIIVAATNRDLKRMIDEGKFRADLYHRFRYKINLPALRDRKKDLRLLISFCLAIFKAKEKGVKRISLRALEKLEDYHYPGNFRELMQIVQRAVHEASSRHRDIILERDIQL